MAEESKIAVPERVPCEVCLKEVPGSEALVAEVEDYVAYFCGLDCYEKWKKEPGNADAQVKKPKP